MLLLKHPTNLPRYTVIFFKINFLIYLNGRENKREGFFVFLKGRKRENELPSASLFPKWLQYPVYWIMLKSGARNSKSHVEGSNPSTCAIFCCCLPSTLAGWWIRIRVSRI